MSSTPRPQIYFFDRPTQIFSEGGFLMEQALAWLYGIQNSLKFHTRHTLYMRPLKISFFFFKNTSNLIKSLPEFIEDISNSLDWYSKVFLLFYRINISDLYLQLKTKETFRWKYHSHKENFFSPTIIIFCKTLNIKYFCCLGNTTLLTILWNLVWIWDRKIQIPIVNLCNF